MSKQRNKSEITSVTYTYVGTDAQFDEFLEMLVRDYFTAGQPCMIPPKDSVQRVESEVA